MRLFNRVSCRRLIVPLLCTKANAGTGGGTPAAYPQWPASQGERGHGRWTDGKLVADSDKREYDVQNGIPRFVDIENDPWTEEQIKELRRRHGVDPETLVHRNYEAALKHWPKWDKIDSWIKDVVSPDGRVMEIGCGPGGGLAPLLLNARPELHLLMTDLGHWILEQWRRFAESRRLWPNVSFAQLDVTALPLKAGVFEVITSLGGVSNIPNQANALREMHRVLEVDGRLCFVEGLPDRDDFAALEHETQRRWTTDYPAVTVGYHEILRDAGFELGGSEVLFRRQMFPDESGLAKDAFAEGVTLHLEFQPITGVKRG